MVTVPRAILIDLDGTLCDTDASVQAGVDGAGADPALALDFVNAHAAAASSGLHPYADVRPFLDAVDESNVKLALVTNGASDTQRKTIETLDLVEYFDAVVVSSEHGVSKPDPAIFRIALSELGSEAGSAWHIGDSLESDVAGALGAGLGTVWINRHGKEHRTGQPVPSAEISLLTDLIGRLTDHSQARRD